MIVRAFLYLVWVDGVLRLKGFAGLHGLLERSPVLTHNPPGSRSNELTQAICSAVRRACAWYTPTPLCLQRSSATALLLRRHGIRAAVVIGARLMPVEAHAWVEVDDSVVNDDAESIACNYTVVDRIA